MARFAWLILSNSIEDQDDEFNRWYDNVHVPDLLRVPGVECAERFVLAETQTVRTVGGTRVSATEDAGLRYRYLALYWIETDNLVQVLEEVRARAGTEEMVLSSSLGDVLPMCFREI